MSEERDYENDVEMDEAGSYQQPSNTIDIPLAQDADEDGDQEHVTINLDDELPAAEEITTILSNESAAPQYWLAMASAYGRKNDIESALSLIDIWFKNEETEKETNAKHTPQDPVPFYSCYTWLYLRLARESPVVNETNPERTKAEYLKKVTEYINKASTFDRHATPNSLARGAQSLAYGQTNQAFQYFNTLLKDSHQANLLAKLGKARILLEKRNYKESLKLYQDVLIGRPTIKPDPRIGIGLCFWHMGDKDAAMAAWERSEELYQSEAAYTLISLALLEKALDDLGSEDFAYNYAKAIDYAQRAIRKNAYNSPAATVIASYLFSRRNMEMVVQLSERGLASTDVKELQAEGWFWKGRAHHYTGHFDEALECFETAEKLGGKVLPSIGKALVQIASDKKTEGLDTLQKVSDGDKNNLQALLLLGLTYAEKYQEAEAQHLDSAVKFKANAIEKLETYLRIAKSRQEMPPVEALLRLAKLKESDDPARALSIMEEIVETQPLDDIKVEVYNNIGVLNFLRNNYEAAKINFETAVKELESLGDTNNNNNNMAVTLDFNLARLEDALGNFDAARDGYKKVLAKFPDYLEARIRLVYLDVISGAETAKQDMDALMELDGAHMTVRALQGWCFRRDKKSAKSNDESKHWIESLQKYDRHDTYSLVAMGNFYASQAREIRANTPDEQAAKDKKYATAAECFNKALVCDKYNAYAAQGIAIILAETKRPESALQIFSKVRDTLSDASIYINMAHCFAELKQYQKAIESYEMAMSRGNNDKNPMLLTFLGKAWYARGASEKLVEALNTSIDYSQRALALLKDNPGLEFNVAFVKFHIAQIVEKMEPSQRTVELIESAVKGLKEAIEGFEKVAQSKYAPYSNIGERATMAKNTLMTQLSRALEKQREYEHTNKTKLEEAKRKQDEEREKLAQEKKMREEEQAKREADLAEERKRLQEQAREWSQKAQEDAQREIEREAEMEAEKAEKKKGGGQKKEKSEKAEKAEKKAPKKKKGKRGRKVESDGSEEEAPTKYLSKDYISSGDDASDEEGSAKATDDESSTKRANEEEEPADADLSTRKKRRIVDDDDDDDEE